MHSGHDSDATRALWPSCSAFCTFQPFCPSSLGGKCSQKERESDWSATPPLTRGGWSEEFLPSLCHGPPLLRLGWGVQPGADP